MLTLEEILSCMEKRGLTYEECIVAMPKLSDMLLLQKQRKEAREDWISKKIHGWIDQKGRVHYPQ